MTDKKETLSPGEEALLNSMAGCDLFIWLAFIGAIILAIIISMQ